MGAEAEVPPTIVFKPLLTMHWFAPLSDRRLILESGIRDTKTREKKWNVLSRDIRIPSATGIIIPSPIRAQRTQIFRDSVLLIGWSLEIVRKPSTTIESSNIRPSRYLRREALRRPNRKDVRTSTRICRNKRRACIQILPVHTTVTRRYDNSHTLSGEFLRSVAHRLSLRKSKIRFNRAVRYRDDAWTLVLGHVEEVYKG